MPEPTFPQIVAEVLVSFGLYKTGAAEAVLARLETDDGYNLALRLHTLGSPQDAVRGVLDRAVSQITGITSEKSNG